MNKYTALIYYASIFFIITINVFLLTAWLPQINQTHYFVSHLESQKDKEIVCAYSFIRTPAYFFYDAVLNNYRLYIFLYYTTHIVCASFLFFVLASLTKNYLASFISLCFFIPLLAVMAALLSQKAGLPAVSHFFLNFKNYLEWGPANIGWLEPYFSMRSVFLCFYILSLYFYLKRRYYCLGLALLCTFFIHPNLMISAYAIFFLPMLVLAYKKNIDFKYLLSFIIIGVIGCVPVLLKRSTLSSLSTESLDKFIWYVNMIKDECDDFSALYVLVANWKYLFLYFGGILFLSSLLWAQHKDRDCDAAEHERISSLLLISYTPVIIFIVMALLEFVSVLMKNGFFMDIIITCQIGHKVADLSVLPLIFLIAELLKNAVILRKKYLMIIFPIAVAFLCAGYFSYSHEEAKAKFDDYFSIMRYARQISYLDALYYKLPKDNKYNVSLNRIFINKQFKNDIYVGKSNIFEISAIDTEVRKTNQCDVDFQQRYGNFKVFYDIVKAIEKNIPLGAGIIVPSYMNEWRDSLVDYSVFFVEYPDGNIMAGSPKIAAVLLKRMGLLIGAIYDDLPSLDSQLIFAAIRKRYLSIDKKRLQDLRTTYPLYEYFITESSHILDLPIIFKNREFVIYRISQKYY